MAVPEELVVVEPAARALRRRMLVAQRARLTQVLLGRLAQRLHRDLDALAVAHRAHLRAERARHTFGKH